MADSPDIILDPLPFDESYWIIEGKFMAGEYPGRREEMESRSRIQALIRSGIRVCIDLTKPGEINPSYREILLEELTKNGLIGNYYHFPIYDFGIPSQTQMNRTLDVIDNCVHEKYPVYVHCHAGVGRTGLTVGCYLVRHGMTGDKALDEITRLRNNVASSWSRSPETDAQVEYVRAWKLGE